MKIRSDHARRALRGLDGRHLAATPRSEIVGFVPPLAPRSRDLECRPRNDPPRGGVHQDSLIFARRKARIDDLLPGRLVIGIAVELAAAVLYRPHGNEGAVILLFAVRK